MINFYRFYNYYLYCVYLKACDQKLMPSYPQHRNLKPKSEEPIPRPVVKSETDDRYNRTDLLF
jgi:hypothetical protein